MKRILYLLGLIVVLMAPVMSEALPVPIVNSSFEDAPSTLTDGVAIGSIIGWEITGNRAGTYNPTTLNYPSGIPGENYVAFVSARSGISQLLNYNLTANTQLILSVDVGWRNDKSLTNYTIQLLAGGEVLTSLSDYPLTRGQFTNVQLVYDVLSSNPLVDRQLSIAFFNTGNVHQVHFDNVTLENHSHASVPEPSTLILLGAGLVGFGVFASRRRK